MTRIVTGLSVKHWVNAVKHGLQKYTDRYIEVRYKPNAHTSVFWRHLSIAEQAENTHCVVTSVSPCAIEAQLLGIPTICPHSFAADISSVRLDEIENPKRVDTQQWFNNLAYSLYTC